MKRSKEKQKGGYRHEEDHRCIGSSPPVPWGPTGPGSVRLSAGGSASSNAVQRGPFGCDSDCFRHLRHRAGGGVCPEGAPYGHRALILALVLTLAAPLFSIASLLDLNTFDPVAAQAVVSRYKGALTSLSNPGDISVPLLAPDATIRGYVVFDSSTQKNFYRWARGGYLDLSACTPLGPVVEDDQITFNVRAGVYMNSTGGDSSWAYVWRDASNNFHWGGGCNSVWFGGAGSEGSVHGNSPDDSVAAHQAKQYALTYLASNLSNCNAAWEVRLWVLGDHPELVDEIWSWILSFVLMGPPSPQSCLYGTYLQSLAWLRSFSIQSQPVGHVTEHVAVSWTVALALEPLNPGGDTASGGGGGGGGGSSGSDTIIVEIDTVSVPPWEPEDSLRIDFQPLLDAFGDLSNRFPFTLVTGLRDVIQRIQTGRQAPHIQGTITVGGYEAEINIDLAPFEDWAALVRMFMSVLLAVGFGVLIAKGFQLL